MRIRTLGVVTAAALGVVMTLSTSPAFAQEGYFNIGSGQCQAIEKIEVHQFADGNHDAMANDPTQNSASDPYWCLFTLVDNGSTIWSSAPATGSGSESPWYEDSSTHHMQACVALYYNGTRRSNSCGPLN